MAFGPKGTHINLDSYVTTSPPTAPNTISGNLVAPPKMINAGDAKVGPRKGKTGQISPDSFSE
jgi:hypothetical protein